MALIFKRSIHSSRLRQGPNPLFHLQALSNARETARATQLSKLPRTAHSPQLQLLQAEASLTPLASDRATKTDKDSKTVVNLAKAESPKHEASKATSSAQGADSAKHLPKMSEFVASLDAQGHAQVAKEIQNMRQELGEWQASVDNRLALISYDLKRIRSGQGPSGWLVAFGAFFFICTWGLVTFAAEKKMQQAAPKPSSDRPKRTIPPEQKARPQPGSEEQEAQRPSRVSKAAEVAPTDTSQTSPPQSRGWFW